MAVIASTLSRRSNASDAPDPKSAKPRATERLNRVVVSWLLAAGLALGGAAQAAVQDVVVADVTTRAFAVVWISDEPVATATLRIFSDPDGLTDITSQFALQVISNAQALAQGVVKVDAVGLSAGDTVYVQTQTESGSGLFLSPAAPPFLPVVAALRVRKANDADAPITNDVIAQSAVAPDGVSPGDGILVLLDVPSMSDYPLSAFAGDSAPEAIVDLNNLFDAATGESAELLGGETLEVTEYRGLLCVDADTGLNTIENHRLQRLRRVPVHEESPPITELEAAADCFAPNGTAVDYNCDGRIGFIDFTRFLANFRLERPDCRFNSDFDLNDDNRVGFIDFTGLLSVFGTQE